MAGRLLNREKYNGHLEAWAHHIPLSAFSNIQQVMTDAERVSTKSVKTILTFAFLSGYNFISTTQIISNPKTTSMPNGSENQ
jgi:hypothetical protein